MNTEWNWIINHASFKKEVFYLWAKVHGKPPGYPLAASFCTRAFGTLR